MKDKETTSLHFTEEMHGAVTTITQDYENIDYARCYRLGRQHQTELKFRVTIHIPDPHHLRFDPSTPATLSGWLTSPLFGEQCPIHDAAFQLFVPVSTNRHEMRYRIVFSDMTERLFTLIGYKTIQPRSVLCIWPDTTTLYTRIFAGVISEWPSPSAECLHAGILRISLLGFLKQMTTLKTSPPGFAAIKDFFSVFAGRLFQTYVIRRS